jgi:DNA sulfur modification protein DndD
MKFERLELYNFASYFGEHSIDFDCNPDQPVIVILGGTGQGKTTLFDAVNWALYGMDYEVNLKERRNRGILDYVNETALQEAQKKKEFVEMSCTLYFEHEGRHYYITQSLAAGPYLEGDSLKAQQSDRMTALYEIQSSGSHKEIRYDSLFLDTILPNNVKDYFLFDGDRIYNLSLPGSSQEVRDAIYRVVDLELLSNARDHLRDVATEYRRDAKRESKGDLTAVEEQYEREYERLEKLKEEVSRLDQEKIAIEAQIKKLEVELESLPDTSDLQNRRSGLQGKAEQLEKQLSDVHASLRASAAKAALSFARQPARDLVTILDSKREKGEIPKAVSQTLLTDLLKLNRCICGMEFVEGDPVHQALVNRLDAEKRKPNDQALLDLLMGLGKASALIDEAFDRLREQDHQAQRLRNNLRDVGLEIQQVDQELDKLPKVNVSQLVQETKARRTALVTTERKIANAQMQIQGIERNIQTLEKKRDELSKQQTKARALQLRERLATAAENEIDRIYQVFAENSRQAVEVLTIEEFKRFVLSASEYQVRLSEDYELEVLDSNGNRALQRLSMGQSQCLSLSFITAISRVSEKHPPLVIDMPFGRLDQDVHDAISRRLPELTRQLILFLIPNIEWNETTARNLTPKCSHIYQLDFDEKNRHTTIRPLK